MVFDVILGSVVFCRKLRWICRKLQIMSRDITIMSHRWLRYAMIAKQVNASCNRCILSLTTCELLRHVASCYAAFVWYIIKHLFHENLCSMDDTAKGGLTQF